VVCSPATYCALLPDCFLIEHACVVDSKGVPVLWVVSMLHCRTIALVALAEGYEQAAVHSPLLIDCCGSCSPQCAISCQQAAMLC
jgi:hypothetical protein